MINELKDYEIRYWALFAQIFDALKGNPEDNYEKLKQKFKISGGAHKEDFLGALDYFYNTYFKGGEALINEELLGKQEAFWAQGIFAEIYKNPKSIKRMSSNLRGISDSEGNLYVADNDAHIIHKDIIWFLIDKGILPKTMHSSPYDSRHYEHYVAWQRLNTTNKFAIGESYHRDPPENFIKNLREKNPQFEFIEKSINYITTDDLNETLNEVIVGTTIASNDRDKLQVTIYKNPLSIKRMMGSKAISDIDGNLYIADGSYDIMHWDVLAYLIKNNIITNYTTISWERVNKTDEFKLGQEYIPEENFKNLLEKVREKNSQYKFIVERIWGEDLYLDKYKEPINENATYPNIDYKTQIKEFTKFLLKKYPQVKSVPKVIFKHGDKENAKEFLGKTAYYDPNTKSIILYTEGRHPKDLTRSYSHEFIHFIQDLEGRLGDINTTNTNENSSLQDLEKEAYLEGNINFRNWTDTIENNQKLTENQPSGKQPLNPQFVSKKGFNPRYNYTLVLLRKDGTYGFFGASSSLKTVENYLKTWERDYAYKDEVDKWVIEPLVESIHPSEASGNDKALQTLIDNKRGVAFVSQIYGSENNILKTAETNNIKYIKVEKSPHESYILYKPEYEKDALELYNIADKYGGYLPACDPCIQKNADYHNASSVEELERDIFRIGQLLGYEEESIMNYKKIRGNDLEEKKSKDPFGLNAYALELARGLEEELTKKNIQDLAYKEIPGLLKKGINYELAHLSAFLKSYYKWSNKEDKNAFFDFIENLKGEIKRVPLSSLTPSQNNKDYKNSSSESEAEEFQNILKGEKNIKDHRKEDFYPLLVNKKDNEIIDGNHRHYALSSINSPYVVVLYVDIPPKYLLKENQFLNEDFLGTFEGEEIYKNPKSIKNMDTVRGISDKEGNLYVGEAVNMIHNGLFKRLKNHKIAFEGVLDIYDHMNKGECLLWEGKGKNFIFSDSQQARYIFLQWSEDDKFKEIIEKIYNLFDITQKKHPQFDFRDGGDDLLWENLPTEKQETPNYVLYSDMDGVITDFDSRFEEYSGGIRPSEYEKNLGKDKFWGLVDNKGGVEFWEEMSWMSDGKEYWEYIKKYNPILLSAPSRSPKSRWGKRKWVEKNIPGVKLILVQASSKKNYANKKSILIDDNPQNIEQWINAGGIGILHSTTESTLNQLKKLGL